MMSDPILTLTAPNGTESRLVSTLTRKVPPKITDKPKKGKKGKTATSPKAKRRAKAAPAKGTSPTDGNIGAKKGNDRLGAAHQRNKSMAQTSGIAMCLIQ